MHISEMYMYMRKEGYKIGNLYILLIVTIFLQFALFLCRKSSGMHSKNVNLYKELLYGNVYLNLNLRETLCCY